MDIVLCQKIFEKLLENKLKNYKRKQNYNNHNNLPSIAFEGVFP